MIKETSRIGTVILFPREIHLSIGMQHLMEAILKQNGKAFIPLMKQFIFIIRPTDGYKIVIQRLSLRQEVAARIKLNILPIWRLIRKTLAE